MSDIFEGMRRSRILIPDNTPLSLLAMAGPEALDWLFVPGAEVWITDMVREEAVREPDQGGDRRELHRQDIAEWFARNAHRINIQTTDEFVEYEKAMKVWQMAGMPAELKPSWVGRGEKSILQILEGVENSVADGEAVVAIVDDGKARAAIKALDHVDVDLMGTETYLHWMATRFQVKEAETAWIAIRIAADDKVPVERDDDPVHVFKMA